MLAEDIGVITPYNAMAQQLQAKLGTLPACGAVKVDTVDAFQGQEKRVSGVHCVPVSLAVTVMITCCSSGSVMSCLILQQRGCLQR